MKNLLLCLFIASLPAQFAYADDSAPHSSKTTYDGYSLPLPSQPEVANALPYGVVTTQDLYPLITGYSLTQPPAPAGTAGSYDGTFILESSPATVYHPNFAASEPLYLALGSMLTTIPGSKIDSYYQGLPSKAFVDLSDLSSLQPAMNNQLTFANTPNQTNNVYNIDSLFAAPYSAGSLFHYVPANLLANSPFKQYLAYQQNPGEVYISLVSGALTPPPATEQSNSAYLPQIRRIAAAQTAGVYALQEIFNRSKPVDSSNTLLQQLGKNLPDNNHQPKNEREIEKFMATRRLDPQNGWYQHLQQASPVELQREQLYLQAEMLYELQQVHETEEKNEMLLAINLLTQNYNNRMTLNTQQQVATTANPPSSGSK